MNLFLWIFFGFPAALFWAMILVWVIFFITTLFSKEKTTNCKNGQCKREIFPDGIKFK